MTSPALNAPLRTLEQAKIDMLLKALNAAQGYLLNAKIDLETGASKATAIRTITGGLNMVRDAIASAESNP